MTLQATDDWRAKAACLGEVELMFDSARSEEALGLCESCVVLEQCKTWASTEPLIPYAMIGVVAGRRYVNKKGRRKRGSTLDWRPCSWCTETFFPTHGGLRFCSRECRLRKERFQADQRRIRFRSPA